MASVLFVHSNFPAQFGFLAEALIASGHRCAAIVSRTGRPIGGMPIVRWALRRGTTPGIFGPATRAEADLLRGAAAAGAARSLRAGGFVPDLIVGHPGWGETLFLRELFPRARQILYGELFYRAEGGDVGFDPEFGQPDWDKHLQVHAKNATGALAYLDADRIVSPTDYQAGTFPPTLRERIRVIHEGIDTAAIRPRPARPVRLPDGTVLDETVPVVTFANRRFEPLRGFHTVMRALPAFQAAVPDGHAVLIGSDAPGGYGLSAGEGTTWKARLLAELAGRLDLARIHFTDTLPHDAMLDLLALGRAHVHLSYPFALSWSLLEAMAAECLVIGSRNPPIGDVITDGVTGRLVDMLDPSALAAAMIEACRRPRDESVAMRRAARALVVERYDRASVCRPAWLALIDEALAL